LKVNDENTRTRIRIHYSEAWISGSGSTPKCHGSATLAEIKGLFSKRTGHCGKVWDILKSVGRLKTLGIIWMFDSCYYKISKVII
jgi:hypothetical protein